MYQIEKEDISAIIKTLEITNVLGKTFFITGSTGSLARYCVMALMKLAEENRDKPCRVIAQCRNLEKAQNIWADYLDDPNIWYAYFLFGTHWHVGPFSFHSEIQSNQELFSALAYTIL